MKKLWSWGIGMLMTGAVAAQSPVVPRQIDFADISLRLTEGARREIQEDVDALTRSQTYFMKKVETARLYMPIVEQILEEEGVPQDFKYLVIQESAFIPDAVSVSNAVGFWQFKEPSGMEVGLRIDGHVDERMNIVASTRGACRYLKKFNVTFDNWWFSLQAYNNGLAGAQKVLPQSGYGARSVEVSKQAHWYVKKYLAHRIAYEEHVKPRARPERIYALYATRGGETIHDLARELSVEEEELKSLNVWLRGRRVPEDKAYQVVYPIDNPSNQDLAALHPQESDTESYAGPQPSPKEQYPVILADPRVSNQPFRITINGKRAIVAGRFDDLNTLANKAEMMRLDLMKFNDLQSSHVVKPGQIYYLESKRNRARVYYHTVQEGESLWQISQKYGVKLERLLQKNRLESEKEIAPGMVLWLRFIRPSDVPVSFEDEQTAPMNPMVDHNQEMIEAAMDFLEAEGPENETELPARRAEPRPLPPLETRVEPTEVIMLDSSVSKTQPTDSTEFIPLDSLPKQPAPARQPMLYPVTDSVHTAKPEEMEVTLEEELEDATEPEAVVVTQVTEPLPEPKEEVTSPIIVRPANATQHTVQQGETLYGIARKYAIPVGALMEANNLGVNDPIAIDQVLTIPAENAQSAQNPTSVIAPDGYVMHEVQAGETMYSLARRYEVKVEDLRRWNEKPDYTLKVGEKLKIKQ